MLRIFIGVSQLFRFQRRCSQISACSVPASPIQTQNLASAAPTDSTECPPTPTNLPNTPYITTNQLGAPLPTEVTTSCVQVPFLPLTSVLAVSWAHFGFPEQQATSQTPPVNPQGVPLSGVVPAVRCSTYSDARTRVLAIGTIQYHHL
jgi:hypothetical protein